jgi:hypothetical protein
VLIRNPADPAQSIAVPSRARQPTQVGHVSALGCQVVSEPLHTEAKVEALPPEDPQIVQCCPKDHPLISAPCTSSIQLTRERYDSSTYNRAKEKALESTKDIQHVHSTGIADIFQATEGDITLATFFVPNLANKFPTDELIATRARQLMRREDDLAAIHSNIIKSRFESVRQFERQFENTIHDHDFGPAALHRTHGRPAPHAKRFLSPRRARWHGVEPTLRCLRSLPLGPLPCPRDQTRLRRGLTEDSQNFRPPGWCKEVACVALAQSRCVVD